MAEQTGRDRSLALAQPRRTATDPVCGMTVDPEATPHHATHDGKDYYFCSAACQTRFITAPTSFLGRKQAAKQVPTNAIYTCPMHPQISQARPGSCPICGMTLEPETITSEVGPNHELSEMRRRLVIGAVLTVPIVVLDMGSHLFVLSHILGAATANALELVLATPVVLWAGAPFFIRGWQSIQQRSLNMFTLIAMGTGIAFAYSVVAVLAPGLFPRPLAGGNGSVPTYFEAASVITVLVLLGQVLELRAREETSGAIRSLNLSPSMARRVRGDGGEEDIPLAGVKPGDRLLIRPGEKVPVDGRVLEGGSSVNEAMITGEAMPVAKAKGSILIGGTINLSGSLVMQAEKVGRDTLLAQIVELVSKAQRSRAPIQRLADSVAGWFVPIVIAVAVLAFFAWFSFGPEPRFAFGLVAAVSVLIIACPCALGLATPMSIMVGVGRGAGAGILIRNAEALERLEKVDTFVADKTGTLTEGKPRVIAAGAIPPFGEDTLIGLAASVERLSEHPIAAAIVDEAKRRNLPLSKAEAFAALPGRGVRATVDGRQVSIGSADFLSGEGIGDSNLYETQRFRQEGASVIFVSAGGVPAGFIVVADPIKDTTPAALKALRAHGLRVVMLTGDIKSTAESIAAKLGIAEVEAGVLPDGKAAAIQRLRREGRVVAMAGDGVNDAPALAAADVGIAMATGSDIAIESAGVTLLHGDIGKIADAISLSRATMRNIRQNLFFAFIYNAAGIPIAAGALYPIFGILLSPMIAAAAMSLSSVSVIGNALRLRSARL